MVNEIMRQNGQFCAYLRHLPHINLQLCNPYLCAHEQSWKNLAVTHNFGIRAWLIFKTLRHQFYKLFMKWTDVLNKCYIWKFLIFWGGWALSNCAISHQMGFFQNLQLKNNANLLVCCQPIFFMVIGGKKMGNWRCFKFKIWKKPIWCEMAQIGQRQIAIYVISVGQAKDNNNRKVRRVNLLTLKEKNTAFSLIKTDSGA